MHRIKRYLAVTLAGSAFLTAGVPAQQGPPPQVSLPEALELFHRHSPRMQMARARLQASLGNARQGRAIPNLAVSASHEELGDYSESYLLLNQPLAFLWESGSRSGRAAALIRESRARFAADSARLTASIKASFVDAWASANTVEALRTANEVIDGLVADAEARVEEGDLAGYDLRRLRWERARLSRRLALGEVALEEAERDLGALVSEGTSAVRVAAMEFDPGGPPDPGLEGAVEQALSRRSELVAAEASIRALEEEADLVGRSWLAGTSATGGVKTQSDGAEGWYVGLEVPLPFSDRRSAARMGARAAVDEARARQNALVRSVILEVSRAEARLRSLRMQAQLVGSLEDDGVEALLEIARVSYAEGEIGIVELLDAAAAYLEARLTGDRVRAEAWVAYFDLEAAVGGLDPARETGRSDR